MPDRIVDISEDPTHVALRHGLIVLKRENQDPITIAPAEIAVLVASQPQVTLTLPALAGLAEAGATVVVCGDNRLPVGLMLPLQGNYVQAERMAAQVAAPLPVKKRIWQSVVIAKIRAQASALQLETGSDSGLFAIAKTVRSGDPNNREAYAAQRYWIALLGEEFVRDRNLPDVNRVLNYGYTVLRAITARAVCAVGLHPSIGVHHHNRYSQFALADDLMEPFRPIVDRAAVSILKTWGADAALDRNVKGELLAALHARYRFRGERRQIFEIVARCASSLVERFKGERDDIELPEFPAFFPDSAEGA